MSGTFNAGFPNTFGNQYGPYIFDVLLASGQVIQATVDLSEKQTIGLRWAGLGTCAIIPIADVQGWRHSQSGPDLLEEFLHATAEEIRNQPVMVIKELPAKEPKLE